MTRRTAAEPPALSFRESMADRRLLGAVPAFRNLETWRTWLVVFQAVEGGPLDAAEERLFCELTGRARYRPPEGGWRRVGIWCGRGGGKTTVTAAYGDHVAVTCPAPPVGELWHSVLMSQDLASNRRALTRAARAPFTASRMLAEAVSRRVVDSLELSRRVAITTLPCRPEAGRGLVAVVGCCDEVAHFRSSEDGTALDFEAVRALGPSLALTGGRLILTSTPAGQRGVAWSWHQRAYGREDPEMLVVQAASDVMNPRLPRASLEQMRTLDPQGYEQEVRAQFLSGVHQLVEEVVIEQAVLPGVRELLPERGVEYVAFDDAASGSGKDAWASAIARKGPDGVVWLCALRVWAPPFSPESVAVELAGWLRSYGLCETTGDRYAGGLIPALLKRHGVTYRVSERDRSRLYADLVPLLNAGQARLLDHPRLLAELRGLERKRGLTREHIGHPPGGHDDAINAVAGALTMAALGLGRRAARARLWGSGVSYFDDEELEETEAR
jgi:hypothetical protein